MHKDLLICSECNEALDVTVEDGQMFFNCENCGWFSVKDNYFYLTGWDVEIRQALAPVDILQSLLTTDDVVEFLRPRLKGVSYLSNYTDASREYMLGELNIAYQVYLRQMIVLSATYAELLLKNFFWHLFVSYPQRMNKYLTSEGKGNARVSLNEVISAESKEDLLMTLAERAASTATGPKIDKVIEGIIKECRLSFDRPLVKDIRNLNQLRNRIVHEGVTEEVSIQQIHNYFGLVLFLLYVLGRAAEEYKMFYWDDFGFMNDFEAKLMDSKSN